MSNIDFNKTHLTNALTTTSNRRNRRPLMKSALVLVALSVGWYVIN